MSQTVKIPVVERKRPLVVRLTVYSFIAICILFFTTIIFSTSKTLMIISIFLVIASGLIMILFKKYSIEGYLMLSPENIVIKTKTLDRNVSVKNLTNLKFSYGGFNGDFYVFNPKSISVKDGTDNFISLQNEKNETYFFELLLNKSILVKLTGIFNAWKQINSNFVIIGEWGMEIKSF